MQSEKFGPRAVLLILLLGILPSRAFVLIPISATLTPGGYGAATSFRVENESSNRVAFQITMITREMDEHGEETYQSASNLFTVFPPQGVVSPGKLQNIRVVWKGPRELTNELAYRIVAEELPVNFGTEPKESHIKLLVRYMGTVYIRPKNVKPNLRAISLVKAAENSASTNLYELTLENNGGAHQGLKNCMLTVTGPGTENLIMKTDQLNTLEGQNVLAHHRRRFFVTLPAGWREQEYHAALQADE